MEPCPTREELRRLAEGAADPAAEALVAHVEGCRDCQRALEELTTDPFATLPPSPVSLEAAGHAFLRRLEENPPPPPQADQQFSPRSLGRAAADDPQPSRTPEPARLPGYQLLHPIGDTGGMGTVYKAIQESVGNRVVAIKRITPHRVGPHGVARFQREIVAGGMLEHPNIVRVYDAGVADGWPFLVMEYLDGLSLTGLLKARGRLPVHAACWLARQAAIGLDYAHRCGIIHRDIKLSNLFLTRLGQVKLLDLGLARLTGVAEEERLTQAGVGVGTLGSMAPEQVRDAHAAGVPADLYGLGGVLFRLLTGRPPSSGRLRDLRPDVPEALAALLDRLLDEDPARRPASAAAVAAKLRPLAGEGEPAGLLDGTPAGPAEVLDAALEVLLWDERERRHVSVTEPGVLPLRPGARLQLQVRLSRPGFVYLVWINTEGEAQPLYPWQGGRWEGYSAAAAVERLFLPPPEADGAYRPLTLTGPSGVETLVLLAHAEALPESVVGKLSGRLSGLGRPGAVGELADSARGYWFSCREEECVAGTRPAGVSDSRGLAFGGTAVRDPIFQIHSLLRDRLGDRLGLIRAVSFANLGDEEGRP
jgi:hypothetical protein